MNPSSPNLFQETVYSISQITFGIKGLLEQEYRNITVRGEISKFTKNSASGHWYFTLKDDGAVLDCAMWKGNTARVKIQPTAGMQVLVIGSVSVYPPSGKYQLIITSMQPAGEGALMVAFEKLKQKLLTQGLFEQDRKKPLPVSPMRVGIVTSKEAAALQDMISVAARRNPLLEIILAPCSVQGTGAAVSIKKAIEELNNYGKVDVIICGRGGGSVEDLWAFNEEVTALAIANSHIPIISAVGHEVDFTIADFVADVRAATPTAAMELITPQSGAFGVLVEEYASRIRQAIEDKLDAGREHLEELQNSMEESVDTLLADSKQQLNYLLRSRGFFSVEMLLQQNIQQIDVLTEQMQAAIEKKVTKDKHQLEKIALSLEKHNVKGTLKRGFSLLYQRERLISRLEDLKTGAEAELVFFDGKKKVIINE